MAGLARHGYRTAPAAATSTAMPASMDTSLVVDVPEGNAWGNAGILSADALVWLDAFRDDAKVDVIFEIDPDRTDGFVLALAHPGYGGVGGNPTGHAQCQLLLEPARAMARAPSRKSTSTRITRGISIGRRLPRARRLRCASPSDLAR